MENKKKIECMNYIIKEYLNDKGMRNWLEGNMIYYRNRLNENATPKQAFCFNMQSALSIFQLKREEEQEICDELWSLLESKNHSLTRLF